LTNGLTPRRSNGNARFRNLPFDSIKPRSVVVMLFEEFVTRTKGSLEGADPCRMTWINGQNEAIQEPPPIAG
jgi:hypothetical protein